MARVSTHIERFIFSKDGTAINYKKFGCGPGIILLHGSMKSSCDFIKLMCGLSDIFTVYVPDRRGRGLSGQHGDHYGIMREVEDVQALIVLTEARYLFGLSSGGLVALRTALETPSVEGVALYEPPLSINDSVPTRWGTRYRREIAQGEFAAAVVTALKGIGTEPLFSKLPRFILVPLMALIMKIQDICKHDAVTIRKLAPTMYFDMHLVNEMSDRLRDYAFLKTPTLLLGGLKSPSFLAKALDALWLTLPNAKLKIFPTLRHDGPEDDGEPDLIAKELREFFRGKNT